VHYGLCTAPWIAPLESDLQRQNSNRARVADAGQWAVQSRRVLLVRIHRSLASCPGALIEWSGGSTTARPALHPAGGTPAACRGRREGAARLLMQTEQEEWRRGVCSVLRRRAAGIRCSRKELISVVRFQQANEIRTRLLQTMRMDAGKGTVRENSSCTMTARAGCCWRSRLIDGTV
jgi:hypothetical protein